MAAMRRQDWQILAPALRNEKMAGHSQGRQRLQLEPADVELEGVQGQSRKLKQWQDR